MEVLKLEYSIVTNAINEYHYIIHLVGKIEKSKVNIAIEINKKFDEDGELVIKQGSIDISLYDILFNTYINKSFPLIPYDRLESIIYEMLGRYFGLYEGSKPKDLEYFEFESIFIKEDIIKDLGLDN